METQAANTREKYGDVDEVCSDRISQLPESVLLHILCFLSQKKAVQTCLLSKSWRHLGPTRPVIDLRGACHSLHAIGTDDFCENCFNGNNEAFISVLEKTFQRYHDQNLFPQELRLKMSKVDSQSNSLLEKWIPIFVKPSTRVTKFRLTVANYLPTGNWPHPPSAVFKAKSLENLYLRRCKIISLIENVLLQNLQSLTLSRVYIDDESLKKIMCGCPLVEYADLSYCQGLKTISVSNENQYLKDFKFVGCYVKNRYSVFELDVIKFDVPALQSIHIERCSNWKLNRDNFFPYLKSLCLFFVRLSTESFENFSYNFPLLEDFTLHCCLGFQEIKLFSPSLKHLTMRLDSSIKVDIDAPNILRFKFSGNCFPTAISFTTASAEWRTKISFKGNSLPWFLELNEMVKALSRSQISLKISDFLFLNSMQNIECGIDDPAVVENVEIIDTRSSFNPIPRFFYALFQICRPRYVTTWYGLQRSNYYEGWFGSQNYELIDCIWEILIDERENNVYYWQEYLEEVSVEAYDCRGEVLHQVPGTCVEAYDYRGEVLHQVPGTCLPGCASKPHMIRFELKWRD